MNQIQKTRIEEIKERHGRIGGYLRNTLQDAIRIGELLIEQKEGMDHGNWLPWIKENLPFSERSAQDYIRFYDRRKELKSAPVADLRSARKYLAAPKTAKKPAKKKAAPVDSKVLYGIVGLYQRLYQETTGQAPFVGGMQYGIVKNLLRQNAEEEIAGRLEKYFSKDLWFTREGDFSLKGFINHYNEINDDAGGPTGTAVYIGDGKIGSDAQYILAGKMLRKYWTALESTENFKNLYTIMDAMHEYSEKRKKDVAALDVEISDDEIDAIMYNQMDEEWMERAVFIVEYMSNRLGGLHGAYAIWTLEEAKSKNERDNYTIKKVKDLGDEWEIWTLKVEAEAKAAV